MKIKNKWFYSRVFQWLHQRQRFFRVSTLILLIGLLGLGGYIYFAAANRFVYVGRYNTGDQYYGNLGLSNAYTREYFVVADGVRYRAVCAMPRYSITTDQNYNSEELKPDASYGRTQEDVDLIKKVLLLTEGTNDLPYVSNWPLVGYFDWDSQLPWLRQFGNPFTLVHSMVGVLYGDPNPAFGENDQLGWDYEGVQQLKAGINVINNFWNNNPQLSSYLSGYKVYRTFRKHDNQQEIVWLEGSGSVNYNGSIQVTKTSSNPSVTNGNSAYSLAGAQFGICSSENCNASTASAIITTNTSGLATINLTAGNYYVKEIEAPLGYSLSSGGQWANVKGGDQVIYLTFANDPLLSSIVASKTSSDPATIGDPSYSLAGARFRICTDQECASGIEVVTDSDGNAPAVGNLPGGTYYVKEIEAPQGYSLNSTPQEVYVPAGESRDVTIANDPIMASINIQKTSTDPATIGSTYYSLDGAEFQVCKNQECSSGSVVRTVTTSGGGYAQATGLSVGSYYVKETVAPLGYNLNSEGQWVNLATGSTGSVIIANTPKMSSLTVQKTSSDPRTIGNPNYSLANAQFQICTDGDCNNVVETVTTGDDGFTPTTNLFGGTYYVKETVAPLGYNLNSEIQTVSIPAGEVRNVAVTNTPILASLTIQKTSSNPVTIGNSNYSLSGAEFQVCTDGDCNNVVETVTTGSDGYTSAVSLPGGTYYVKETVAPLGYNLNSEIQTVSIPAGEVRNVAVTNTPILASLTIQKTSSNPVTIGNSNYSLSGAEFQVCTDGDCNNVVETVTTGSDGYTSAVSLPGGTYYVKETVAPQGYLASTTVSDAIILALEQSFTYEISNQPQKGGVKVRKVDADTNNSLGQGDASLDGTVFGIYDINNTQIMTIPYSGGTATTGAGDLLLGDYYVQETEAGEGYNLSEQKIDFSVTENGVVVDLTDTPFANQVKRGRAMIRKCDLETGACDSLGGASLDGTQFALINRSAQPVIMGGTEYAVGAEMMRVGATNTYAVFENIPYGTYDMIEVVPGEGYLLGDPIAQQVTVREDTGGVHWTINDPVPAGVPVVSNQVKRADLKLIKFSADKKKGMQGVPFKVTVKATGEAHIIVTDVNGFASTHSDWNKHSVDTNQNDTFLMESGVINVDELNYESGIWFGAHGEGEMSPVNDDLGALPYGVYEIEELRSTTNEGYQLMQKREFRVERDGVIVDLGTIENEPAWKVPSTGRATKQPASARVTEINVWQIVVSVAAGLLVVGGGVVYLRKHKRYF